MTVGELDDGGVGVIPAAAVVFALISDDDGGGECGFALVVVGSGEVVQGGFGIGDLDEASFLVVLQGRIDAAVLSVLNARQLPVAIIVEPH